MRSSSINLDIRAHSMKIAIITVHRNRPDLVDEQVKQIESLIEVARDSFPQLECRVLLVDCGSDLERRSEHPHYWYPDPDFSGKLLGHLRGIELVGDQYDYYWINHPDIDFKKDSQCLEKLLSVMEENKAIGIMTPKYNGSFPGVNDGEEGQKWHQVASMEFLSGMIRGDAMREIGTPDRAFTFGWGLGMDYSYRMWSAGWIVACCDWTEVEHLGPCTYGANGTKTISRKDYLVQANRQALELMSEKYGERWEVELAKVLPSEVKTDNFKFLRDDLEHQKVFLETGVW